MDEYMWPPHVDKAKTSAIGVDHSQLVGAYLATSKCFGGTFLTAFDIRESRVQFDFEEITLVNGSSVHQ